MGIVLLLLAVLVDPDAAQAKGTIKGCITEKSGAVLPGAELVASSPEAQQKVVTDASGCYQFRNLPAGAAAQRQDVMPIRRESQ